MNFRNLLSAAFIFISLQSVAQSVSVNTDGSTADASALLEVKSTGKGILIPRMTDVQRTGITSPATGLLVYQTNGSTGFYYNSGTPAVPSWLYLATATGASASGVQLYAGTSGGSISQTITDVNIRNVVVTFSGLSAAGAAINLTLPSASSYPSGSIIAFATSSYITGVPTWVITSPSSTINSINLNNASTAAGVSLGANSGFRLLANGSVWYRLF